MFWFVYHWRVLEPKRAHSCYSVYTNRDVSDLIGFSPFHNSIFVHFVQSQFNENYYANCILREFVFKLTSIRTMFRSSDNCWHSLSWSFSLARHRLAQLFFFCENSNSNNSNKTLKTYQTLFMPIQNRSCHSISKFINLTSIGDSPNGIEHWARQSRCLFERNPFSPNQWARIWKILWLKYQKREREQGKECVRSVFTWFSLCVYVSHLTGSICSIKSIDLLGDRYHWYHPNPISTQNHCSPHAIYTLICNFINRLISNRFS